jgi:hypothetical protein
LAIQGIVVVGIALTRWYYVSCTVSCMFFQCKFKTTLPGPIVNFF